jgi:succinate-semialdehyde dehydrogenase / glutarate-semialdehyde dehydrogenase
VPIATTNPATGQVLETFEPLTPDELEAKVALSAATYAAYRRTSFDQRADWLTRAAELFEERAGELAALATLEMGKTLASAVAEVRKCAKGARFYAEHAAEFLADEPADPVAVGADRAYTRWEPIGPVLAVMPWNYPYWQVMRFLAPTLMAGNTGLLKHASNVPRCALAIEDVLLQAGFPAGVFQTLLIGSDQVETVIADPRVAAVTLTGSEGAGRSVGAAAGRAIKKVVLELGGNDAFVVLPSADLARAAAVGAVSRCQNNGQSCIAAKRFIVHEDVADQFAALLVQEMSALVVGDPRLETTDIGPLATWAGVTDIEDVVLSAVAEGASVLLGGRRVSGPGWYYEPTVLSDLKPTMRIVGEEVFGPVVQLFHVPSLDAAIELANASDLGLSSSAWTTDPGEQDRLIAELEAGAVFVNGMSASYPELPFGGIKSSGHGRELAALGIKEFGNAKTVWVSG